MRDAESLSGGGGHDGTLSEETGRFVLDELRRQARSAPMERGDSEDLVMAAAVWILQHRISTRPVTRTWVLVVFRAFLRGFYRDRIRRCGRSFADLAENAEPSRPPRNESASLDELTRGLDRVSQAVVGRMIEGFTWKEALEEQGVRPGSHSRWRERIRREVQISISAASLDRRLRLGR